MKLSKSDFATILGKGLVGWVPFVGPLAAELVGNTIPNQRMDRIASMLKVLEEKIEEHDKAIIKERFSSPEIIDIIEEGFMQASRALSKQRSEYIAILLKNSLTDEEIKHLEYKRMLNFLSQINDIEILILISHAVQHTDAEAEFWKKHEETVLARRPHDGASQKEWDKYELFQANNKNLVVLGLLKISFKKPTRGELPEFDENTGMIKGRGYGITNLGRLLLKSIDINYER